VGRAADAGTLPPVAARREVVHELHGVERVDAYAWLRDTASPDVMAHLEAERAYYDVATQHLRPNVKTLSQEMSARLPATDWSISYRRLRFSYYTLTPGGSEYAQLCRGGYTPQAVDDSPPEPAQVLLDPAQLAAGSRWWRSSCRGVSRSTGRSRRRWSRFARCAAWHRSSAARPNLA
jgi:oligopeptidase B